VDLRSTNRRIPAWLILGLVGLSLLVFAWGLGYKLSLYDSPQSESHKIQQAKLLSENERALVVQSPLLSDTKAPPEVTHAVLSGVLLFLVLAHRVLNAPVSSLQDSNVNQSWHQHYRTGLNFFFVLPPPVRS
jgi:hypothetical protein